MHRPILEQLQSLRESGRKAFAVLLDPDDIRWETFPALLEQAVAGHVDFFLVGGSLITTDGMAETLRLIRQHTHIPVLLFPGSNLHVSPEADALLLLSLISGRNPDFLIGQHVVAAPMLRKSGLELLPTGYMLVDSGRQTTASYISGTTPLPHDKPGVAACTAMAGEMLGLQLMYLDGGSGAECPVSPEMIAAVRQSVRVPLIVGGGINSPARAKAALQAGADLIVVGNGIEKDPSLLGQIAGVMKACRQGVVQP